MTMTMTKINARGNALARAILAALIAAGATPGVAQQATQHTQTPGDASNDSATGTEGGSDNPTALSGITVTAQKREELLQNVPITITVLNKQLLQDAGVHDIKEMQILVPGLSVTSTGSETQTTARIRGVGTVGDNPGLESSVGVVIDGVYRPRDGVGFGDLGEIQSIEVLKGPQGTVFGKNTSAGLINVTTVAPKSDREATAELTAGNYDAFGIAASYNDRLGEDAAFRIYAVDRQRDGFLDVNTGVGPRTSRDDGDQDLKSLRAQLAWNPSDTLDLRFIADYTKRNEQCCAAVTTFAGPAAPIVNAVAGGNGVIPVADPSQRLAYSNRDTNQNIKDEGISAEANWQTPWFGGATLTSITAARNWNAIGAADLDYSGADIWYRNGELNDNSVQFRTFSEELRLTGTANRVDWMVGAYFDHEDLTRHDAISLGKAYEPYLSIALLNNIAANFPKGVVNTTNAATFLSEAAGQPYGTSFIGDGSNDRYNQHAKSGAIFTNETVHATDKLDLDLGLRYTDAKKDADSFYSNPNGAIGCSAALASPAKVGGALAARGVPLPYVSAIVPTVIGYMCLPWSNVLQNGRTTSQNLDEQEWSGTLRAAYRWNEQFMTYASGARGYKAGGFNLDRVQSANGLSSGGSGITPVNDTSFPGEFVDAYELGTKTTWADGNLLLNAALFHEKFTDFQLNSFLGTSYVVRSIPQLTTKGVDADVLWQTPITGLKLQGGVTYTDARYGDDPLPDADLVLLPGARSSFSPLWQGSAALTYEWDFGSSLAGRFNLSSRYTSSYNTGSNLNPLKDQDAYTLVNARFGFGAKDQHWGLEFWIENLTNKTYTQVGFDAPLQTGSINSFLGAPRTYGVTLRLKY
jgi:iron complex outermembrane recepter protein